MSRSTPDKITLRITAVLDELRFPALRWQLIAEADHYGADRQTRDELERLPAGRYHDVRAVISTIKATSGPVAPLPTPTPAAPAVNARVPEPRRPRPVPALLSGPGPGGR